MHSVMRVMCLLSPVIQYFIKTVAFSLSFQVLLFRVDAS